MTPDELKKNRERLNLSQKELGKALDLSIRFVIYRETGERTIPQWFARAVRDLVKHPKKLA